jgi:hypothetical protein
MARLLLVGLALLFRQLWVFLEEAFHKQTGLEQLRTQVAHQFVTDMTDNTELTMVEDDARLCFRTVVGASA